MLSWLKPHHNVQPDGSNKKQQQQQDLRKNKPLFQLVNDFIHYVKSIKFFDPVLPPSHSQQKQQTKNGVQQQKPQKKDQTIDARDTEKKNEQPEKPEQTEDQKSDESSSVKDDESKKEEVKDLFPKTILYDKDIYKGSTAVSCSMAEKPAKVIKFENADGLINWKFEGNNNIQIKDPKIAPHTLNFNSLTSPFLASTGSTISSQHDFSPPNKNLNLLGHINSPSPISMNQQMIAQNPIYQQNNFFTTTISTNSDLDSNHSLEDELAKIPDLPNPEFFNINFNTNQQLEQSSQPHFHHGPKLPQQLPLSHFQHSMPHDGSQISLKPDLSLNSPTLSDDSSSNSHQDMMKKSTKVYTCGYCGSEFKIRGYLTRHIKKHAITKAYECPFFDAKSDSKCHPNGGFSRRDTYKTHLKARHFKYPPGTQSKDRTNTPGKCRLCSKPYDNNEEWVEKHIENGECEGLPEGFQIRIKNSRKKNYEFPNIESPDHQNNSTDQTDDMSNTSSSESSNNETTSPTSTNSFSFLQRHHSNFQSQQQSLIQNQQHNQQFFSQQAPHQVPQFQHQGSPEIKLLNEQQNSLKKQIIMSSLQFKDDTTKIKSLDYDENDEYSLDMEQCSYRWSTRLANGVGY